MALICRLIYLSVWFSVGLFGKDLRHVIVGGGVSLGILRVQEDARHSQSALYASWLQMKILALGCFFAPLS